MKVNKLTKMISLIEGNVKKKSPAILTGLALVGLGITAYKAYKAGPKIEKILKEKREDLKSVAPEDKDAKRQVTKELVTEVAKEAAPVVIMMVATGACILGSQSISSKRIAVLSAGYAAAEKSINGLNTKMEEILGEKKTRAIKDAIVKDNIEKDGKVPEDKVIITGNGDVLCKDLYSGRYFRSNAEKIRQAIAALSEDCRVDNYVELNELYGELGIPEIPLGSDFGWNVDDLVRGTLPISISAQISENGEPCLCLDYDTRVRADFRNLH